MVSNPFKFGKEVSGDQFYDREEAFGKLYRKLIGGSCNVVMYAPRRYGKTSLVKTVFSRLEDEGIPTVSIDLNKIANIEKFCEQYALALCRLTGKGQAIASRISTYLSHLNPTFSFGGEAILSVKLGYGAKMNESSVSSVLDLAEKIASDVIGGPIAVAFDEFQEIERLSPDLPLEGIFRSCIQTHQNVRYVFLGSKTHMLKRMFGEKSRPFYKSAATIRLEKPPEDESQAFVKSRFASRSIGIDEAAARRIVSETENVPYYLQELSSQVFDAVVAAGRDWVEDSDIDAGIAALMSENTDYYVEKLSTLSSMQRLLVAALAAEPVREFTGDYRARHSLGGSSTVHTALKALIERGVVESEPDGYFIGDPFFSRYVRT